jgi:BirA family transcriptional regulator, biotin operon repressor / biotin---[acetyl-CoA-carboxylase] ligase
VPPGDAWPAELREAIDRARPRLRRIATSVRFFASIGSTNDVALQIGSEGAVVLADEQTAGRGRRGHTWFSPPGSGLYTSVVVTPAAACVEPLRAVTLLTIGVGVAVAEGIEAATGLAASLKWPNDVYVGPRKLAGILAESAGQPSSHVVAGYGINVSPSAYPPALRDRATDIETELGRRVDRFLVLAETLAALESRYGDLLDGRFDAILDAWRRRAPGATGARVSWITTAGERQGVTAGIDRDGALLVRSDGQVERIVGGAVEWLSSCR